MSDAFFRDLAMPKPHFHLEIGSGSHAEQTGGVMIAYEKVARAERVRVRALNAKGEPFELDAEGLLAVCIQHEIDHLDGKVFVEYLSALKLSRIKGKLAKKARITA